MRWRGCCTGAIITTLTVALGAPPDWAQTPAEKSSAGPGQIASSPDSASKSPTAMYFAPDGSVGQGFTLTPSDGEPPSVYAPPQPPSEQEGVNMGGVNTELDFRYLTDNVYRGVSHDRASGGNIHAANFQAQTELSFNLGKLPHPFVGVFANVNDSDPLSRFQEIRPFFGVDYTLRPLIFKLGHNSYLYPERERLNPSPNTSEVYLKVTLDDSYFFLTRRPILSPYVYAAYDYQRNQGWYMEVGVKHDIVFEDIGFTLTGYAEVAYISGFSQQFVVFNPHDSGFQHWDVGVIGTYSLNTLFNFPARYGDFALEGYLTYTDGFTNALTFNRVLWGGVGLVFKY